MKKAQRTLLIITTLLMPTLAFGYTGDFNLPLDVAIQIEAFVSIHMSVFVLRPLASLVSNENSKKLFWTIFIVRAVVLLFCDFFVTTYIAMIDFFAVFAGALLIVPICQKINKKHK